MGHQLSKVSEYSSEHTFLGKSLQKTQDNDGLSRATEVTDESSLPSSPNAVKLRHTESWRRGAQIEIPSNGRNAVAHSSYPNFQQSHPQGLPENYLGNSTNHPSCRHDIHFHGLQRRDSDPGYPPHRTGLNLQQRRSVPVKCPPRKTQNVAGNPSGDDATGVASHDNDLEESYLERMYDSRTWEMYRRITKARSQSRLAFPPTAGTASCTAVMDPYRGQRGVSAIGRNEDTSEWENLQHEEETSGEEHHEMIFLFDF